ncbi:MAG: family 78 glycoside hydrolase catalytic domain [Clostridia bacterium]|nr:family 78 glycoside hydrolase catalytic domain [Clostridia bacterium]
MFSKQSKWIACGEEVSAPIVWKNFNVDTLPEKSEISICGLGYYELFINGRRVGKDYFKPAVSDYGKRDFSNFHYPLPGEETSHTVYYNVYDVTNYLYTGINTVAVMLGNGFFRQTRRIAEGDGRFGNELLLRFDLTLGKGSGARVISTDGSEAYTESFIKENNLYYGELHDYSSFSKNPFAEARSADARPVQVVQGPEGKLRKQKCPHDRVVRTLSPRLLRKDGDRSIYDAGENISGFVVLRALCDKVTVRHAEELDAHGELFFQNSGMAKKTGEAVQISENQYLFARHMESVSPWFSWSGFRYFEIEGDVTNVEVAVVHSDVKAISSFQCGNETLNWLFDAYIRTQLDNMHGGVTSDCPHRERLGYTGDGQLICESAMLTLDSRRFFEKWIRDIADCQDIHSGHVQHTAPFFGGGGGPGGWGCAMVVVPYTYYRMYGDKSILKTYFGNMTAYLDSMASFCDDKGLVVREREGGWCLGDWCTPGELSKPTVLEWRTPQTVKLPEPLVNTYYYIRSMELMQEIGKSIGKNVDYTSRIERSKAGLTQAYFDPATHDFCGNLQGSNAFALNLGLGDEQTHRNLVAYYTERGTMDTGIFGTDVLLEYLFRSGEAELACRLLTAREYPSFHFMKENGATTIWEYWEDKKSHNHPMFGACIRQLFYGICGIEGDIGFENITVRPPYLEELGFVKVKVRFPKGTLSLHCTYRDGKVQTKVKTTGSLQVQVLDGRTFYRR